MLASRVGMPRRTLKVVKACWAALAWLLYLTGRIG
jgi:hypothetical protein